MGLFPHLFEPDERRRLQNANDAFNKFAKAVRSVKRSSTSSGQEIDIRVDMYLLLDSTRELYQDLVLLGKQLPDRGIAFAMARRANSSFSSLRRSFVELKRDVRGTAREARVAALDRPLDKLRAAIWELYGPTTRFQRELAKLMSRCDVTAYSRVIGAWLSESYTTRLLRGERRNPSRGAVLALASAIEEHSSDNHCGIAARELNRLVKAAGYRPPRRKWRPS